VLVAKPSPDNLHAVFASRRQSTPIIYIVANRALRYAIKLGSQLSFPIDHD
jgi:hypothetical protein